MSVRRYEPDESWGIDYTDCMAVMTEREDGEWVAYDDYLAIVETLNGERAIHRQNTSMLKDSLDKLRADYQELKSENENLKNVKDYMMFFGKSEVPYVENQRLQEWVKTLFQQLESKEAEVRRLRHHILVDLHNAGDNMQARLSIVDYSHSTMCRDGWHHAKRALYANGQK